MEEAANWEVYRDALVPTQNKPLRRPWERAPVSAHAPRLQGRQIWKKAGIRRDNKENDPSQAELESEGAGARKRMRGADGKENIGDALWANSGTMEMGLENGMAEGKKDEEREQLALQFVPRKRTNMDRVITPRKPLRQTTLNGLAQTMVPLNDGDDTAKKPERRRKSMRKSLRRSMVDVSDPESAIAVQKAPLGGEGLSHNNTQQSPEDEGENEEMPQTASRRSLRQSITPGSAPAPTLHENQKATSMETLDQSSQELQLSSKAQAEAKKMSQPGSRRSLRKSVVDSFEPGTIPKAIPSNSDHEKGHDDQEQTAADKAQPVSRRSSRKSVSKEILQPEPEVLAQEPTEARDTLEQVEVEEQLQEETPEQTIINNELIQSPTVPSPVPNIVDSVNSNDMVQAPLPSNPSITTELAQIPLNSLEDHASLTQPDETQQNILPSIEMEESALASKATGTPGKRQGTNSRRGTRRSTRTRASSAKAEELVQETAVPAETQLTSDATGVTPQDAPEPSLEEATVSKAPAEVKTPVKEVHANQEVETTTVDEQSIPESAEDIVSEVDLDSFDLGDVQPSRTPIEVNAAELAVDIDEFDLGATISTRSEDVTPNTPKSEESQPAEPAHILPASMQFIQPDSPSGDIPSDHSSPVQLSPASEREMSPAMSDDQTLEVLEPIFVPADQTLSFKKSESSVEDLPETCTPNPTTSDFVETISGNAPAVTYDDLDDTNMLRNFVTRVKADKAAKAAIPKRKRSLPHSPLQLPLGENGPSMSPSQGKDELDITLPTPSPSKRRRRSNPLTEDELATEPKSIRRSGRTRLPVLKNPVAAPSFIPVRRLGQDADATVTIRRSQDKELAALTKVNTRKNRGAAQAAELLIKRAEEKEDPALRQRLLKEVFDEKEKRNKKEKKAKSVKWKEDIAEYQSADGKKVETDKEEKGAAVRVGVRSKIAVAGTPVGKRKTREKS